MKGKVVAVMSSVWMKKKKNLNSFSKQKQKKKPILPLTLMKFLMFWMIIARQFLGSQKFSRLDQASHKGKKCR